MDETAAQDDDRGRRLLALIARFAAEVHPQHGPPVTMTSSCERDLGFDSLARVELMQRVGEAFHVELSAEALSETDNAGQLLRLLALATGAPAAPATAVDLGQDRGQDLPEQAQTLLDVLEWQAARQPERIHILLHDDHHGEHPLSYRDLLSAARAIAAGLGQRGLQPRQTVALMLPTSLDYLASFFGVMLAGGIPVPIYPPARQTQLGDHLARHARILANAQATFIITIGRAKPLARILQASVPALQAILLPGELRRPGAPPPAFRATATDIAFLQYTSGSTGDPKGVMLTHANLLIVVTALLPPVPGYVFAAKQELRRHRAVRVLLTGLGAIFVERADERRSAAEVEAMTAVLARGDNLLVFPEGPFERAPGLQAFHLGGFLAAARAARPLVVAGLRGTRAALRDGNWLPRRGAVTLEVGDTFQPAGAAWGDAARTSAAARAAMLTLCGECDAQAHA